MLRFRRAAVTLSCAVLLPSLVFAQDAGRMTSASNVRLRAEPVESAAVVVAVPLGTSLVGIETGGPERAWLRVRTADGKEGWVLTRLTRRFDGDKRLDVVEQLVAERLARKGDSFAARAEVVDLVERSLGETNDPERGGRLAVLWIRAMNGVAGALPQKRELGGAHGDWVEARQSSMWWNEVGANWMLSHEALRELHARHRDTSSADPIAWAIVENGLGGECEGYLPCYVERTAVLQGEYLTRHPNGKRVDEAVSAIGKSASFWLTRVDKPDSFTAEKDCGELTKWLTPLRAAVASTTATERETTLETLDRLGKTCGAGGEASTVTAAAPSVATPPGPVPAVVLPTPAESPVLTGPWLFVAGAGVVSIAAMVMLRRRADGPTSNRIT